MQLIAFVVLAVAVATVQGEEGSEKDASSFQRFASGDKYFVAGKRNGGGLVSSGQIYPRLGRSGFHESTRPLLPYSRILRRPYWRYPLDSLLLEYEDSLPGGVGSADGMSPLSMSNLINSGGDPTSLNGVEESEVDKRNGANGGNMWFGPRLGKRRKRSVELDASGERSRETFDTRLLMKLLHNLSWAIVPVKQRRTFTPRLGRSSSEETPTHHSTLPFSPRLGRAREVPSAVEFDLDDDDSQARFARSDGSLSAHGHSTQPPSGDDISMSTSAIAPFSPRLGRDHYSPRLGRSGSGVSGGDDRE